MTTLSIITLFIWPCSNVRCSEVVSVQRFKIRYMQSSFPVETFLSESCLKMNHNIVRSLIRNNFAWIKLLSPKYYCRGPILRS